jgi:predicted CoA-binding protein
MIPLETESQTQTAGRMTQEASPRESLDALFSPSSVAVIGATDRPGTVGQTVPQNLLNPAFAGRVYPVNPQRAEILGVKAFRKIGDVPEAVDLVILATPAVTIPGPIGECIEAQAKSAVVISAGFKETRRGRNCPGTANSRTVAGQRDASDWTQLLGRDESDHRNERHVCQGRSESGQRRIPQPGRGSAQGDSGLEP